MTPPLLALAFLLVALAWWHQQRQAQWRKLRQYHRRQYWEWHKGINPEAARAYLRRTRENRHAVRVAEKIVRKKGVRR